MSGMFERAKREFAAAVPVKRRRRGGFPWLAACGLGVIVLACLLADVIAPKDAAFMDVAHSMTAPCAEFPFGTDTLGRDIFSAVLQGGRVSLFIGLTAAAVSTLIAVVYGAAGGMAPAWLDDLMMHGADIVLSIPGLLLVVFLQAVFGRPSMLSIALIIGVTGWMSMARVVRTQVRQLRSSDYVTAAKSMGAGFGHILRRHLAPNFVSSIMFMVVMSIRGAIVYESTLSFMGIGLPLEVISWGSMLSVADQALLSGAWWVIVIPGGVMALTLMCITGLGNYLRERMERRGSRL